jgi:SAM-dependent methyltransferase
MSKPDTLGCLLCDSTRYTVHSSLTADEILNCWAIDGHQFRPASIQLILDEGMINLYECSQCGFQFFNPKLIGDSLFYEQLQVKGGYYAPDRPENQRNVRYALEHGYRTLLDIGCGPGFALDNARDAGLQTFGIELNPAAAAIAAKRGHTIFPVLLENLDAAWTGKFDLISLNQLLEHVPNPVELIRQCIRFLSPAGTISIAVPGRETVLRFCPWVESNWPPHHVSRWRKKDFYFLAGQTGLQVVKTGGDRLLGSALEMYLLGHRRRCKVLKKPYRGLPVAGIKVISQVYRKTGLKYIFRSQGHSIYCYLKRRNPET